MNLSFEVLRLLSYDLRVATDRQIDAVLPGANRVLDSLSRRGLIATQARPVAIPDLREPVFSWRFPHPAPDFEAVAWASACRVDATRVRRERIVWATRRARRLVGGLGSGLRQPLQVEHDLGVTALYVARHRKHPTEAGRWCGEDAYSQLRRPARGDKRPDGVLLDENGRLLVVFDYLTRYPPARLRSFHNYWSEKRVPYEWW